MALLCVGAAVGTKALVRAAARQMRKSRNYKLRAGYTKKEKEAGKTPAKPAEITGLGQKGVDIPRVSKI